MLSHVISWFSRGINKPHMILANALILARNKPQSGIEYSLGRVKQTVYFVDFGRNEFESV